MSLNAYPLNTHPLNTVIPYATNRVTDDFRFNGFWLQNSNVVTAFTNIYDYANIDISTYSNPIVDWWGVLNRRYDRRIVEFKGVLKADDVAGMNSLIDELKLKIFLMTMISDILHLKGTWEK